MNRRTMLISTAGILAGATRISFAIGATPGFSVTEVKTISLQLDRYHGWPTLIRRKNGELLVVASGGRDSHVCPFGRIELMRSSDHGDNWSFSRTILDGPIDERDAGLLETARGTLLVNTFTSTAYEPLLNKATAAAEQGIAIMPPDRLARWQAAHLRLANDHQKLLGCWMLRSEDSGLTWSPAYRVPVTSSHGPVNLSDGRLLFAGVELWTDSRQVGICTSDDDGKTWSRITRIPTRVGDVSTGYHELHAVEADDGRLIAQIRNHNKANAYETLQTHSMDGGASWVQPYSTGVWGQPSHLLKLSDDRLLMTYGHRRAPLGVQSRLSADNGQSWSEPMVVYGEGTSTDLGYPTTVETCDGKFVTVWYERLFDNEFAQLRMANWHLT